MLNETASAAASVAAWSSDVYAKRDVKPADPLLGPLAKGCVTLLCGARGVGKSWLALALAHTAARGGSLATWRARKRHRVVYIDIGGSEAVLHQRLIALGPQKPPSTLVIVPGDAQAGGLPDASLDSGRAALDQLTTDCDLVVIDGLSALVRKGRGVGTRWAALEDWLRSLRRRNVAVLLVDAREPKALAELADAVLRVGTPVDGVAEGDLRLQAELLSSRPALDAQRFELRMTLRKQGAAWTYVNDVDHRAIIAYRLDRADYSSREIAKMLSVSPATAWRLIGRGERLPPHIRDGVDLEVPEPLLENKTRDWAAIARAVSLISRDSDSLLPREKEGPARVSVQEDEGPAAAAMSTDAGDTTSRGESPSPSPLPRERVPEGEVEKAVLPPQTPQPGEAVKQADTPKTLDDVPTDELVAAALTRRRHSKDGTPPSGRLALFADAELMTIARARLSARVLNRKILEDDTRPLAGPTEPQSSAAVPAAWRRLRS